MSQRIYQRTIPLFLVTFLTTVFVFENFFENPITASITSELLSWGTCITLMTLVYGFFMLLLMHTKRIIDSEKKYSRLLLKSCIVVGTFVIYTLIGIWEGKGSTGPLYMLIYMNIVSMAASTAWMEWSHHMYSPFKMFRITSLETAAMLVTWTISVLRELSVVVINFPVIEAAGDWIMKVPYIAANRGTMMSAGIGLLVLCIRAVAWKEPGIIDTEMR